MTATLPVAAPAPDNGPRRVTLPAGLTFEQAFPELAQPSRKLARLHRWIDRQRTDRQIAQERSN